MNDYGGRRFLLTAFFAGVYTVLLVWGYIEPTIYRDLQVLTIGAYIAGNVYQKHSENKNGVSTQ